MSWKEELSTIEKDFDHRVRHDWESAVDTVRSTMVVHHSNVEACVRCIYILHHILLEEDYPESAHDEMARMLKTYYESSSIAFSENAEYLFFIGKILYVAEWYFGVNDDAKPIENRLAFEMQRKAFNMEPENKIYEWGYAFSKGENSRAFVLSKEILHGEDGSLSWLTAKGFPGEYVIDGVKYCFENGG